MPKLHIINDTTKYRHRKKIGINHKKHTDNIEKHTIKGANNPYKIPKSDYRYSKDIVYNNFPWPAPTAEQRSRIEQSAQAILDARTLYPDSSLADLYDPTLMPKELLQAHRQNDRLVMQAYGFPSKMTESECVAELFKRYTGMVE